MKYLLIPILIIIAIVLLTSRVQVPNVPSFNPQGVIQGILSSLGWGPSQATPTNSKAQGAYQGQETPALTNPLLNTSIIEGPQNNTILLTTPTVTFKFSGTGPKNTPSGALTFETKIEGFDQYWVGTSETSRTVTLPGGKKTYRFLVRSKLGNGVDATPDSRTFTVQVSPYFGKIQINVQAPNSSQAGRVSLSASLNQDESVSITSWRIQAKTDDFTIPQGVSLYLPAGPNPKENIRMTSGTNVTILESSNPLVQNMAFRPNQCFGYFTQTRTFPLSVPSSCPDFPAQRSSISYLSPICQDYITQLPYCRKPNYTGNVAVAGNLECRDYIDTHFSYEICVRDYKNTTNFINNEWHIYTESTNKFLRAGHDQLILYDSNNLLVATYDY